MKTRIKKYKLFFLIPLLLFFAIFAFAQGLEVKYPTVPGAVPGPTLPEYIKYLYNFSIIIAGLIAFFSLIYGGFRYMLSVGQPTAMADAKDQITAGIVGLIILLGSYLFLVAVNPQLAILDIGPIDLALECDNDADCYGEQVCKDGVCVMPIKPLLLTAQLYRLHEIPIGKLIERVLANGLGPGRLKRLNDSAQRIKNLSAQIADKTVQFEDIINDPCNLCSNTNPTPDECDLGIPGADPPPEMFLNYCLPMVCAGDPCLDYWHPPWAPWTPDPVICTGDPCLDKRDDALALKEDIHNLAADLAAEMEAIMPDLTSFKKDTQRLELGIKIMMAVLYPINYDNMLEMKQVILEIGGDVEIVPFTFLNETIRGRGDPATFYTDEDRIKELMASGDWPPFPTLDTLAACDECEIDLHFTGFDIPDSIKDELAAIYPTINNQSCGGIDCWDYIVNWAKANNWNPAFILSLWGEESGFDDDGTPCDIGGNLCWTLGVVDCAAGRGVVAQLDCFPQVVNNCSGFCEAGNTDFCAFMRCYSGGSSCTLSNNPNFWPNLFDLYTRLIPNNVDGTSPEVPSGDCTVTASGGSDPLPPGLAGCPLQPGFTFNCGWEGYPGHSGIDLEAGTGNPIYAIAGGQATAAHDFGTCGNAIRLFTDFGEFRYCHLLDTCGNLCIANGASIGVLKGDLIGHADATGGSWPSHLHLVHLIGGNPYPMECADIECIETAPDATCGICTCPSRINDPTLCW